VCIDGLLRCALRVWCEALLRVRIKTLFGLHLEVCIKG